MFNQQTWIREHKARLPPSTDVDRVFQYVVRNHPLAGVSSKHLPNPAVLMRMKIETQARYADAVTVYCCTALGSTVVGKLPSTSNATTIGNYAYMALNHPDTVIRQTARFALAQLRPRAH